MARRLLTSIAVLLCSAAIADNDNYLRGYAQAILDTHSQSETIKAVAAEAGKLTLRSDTCVSPAQRAALEKVLTKEQDIVSVEWQVPPCTTDETLQRIPSAKANEDTGILPEGELFAPLLAGPRQPQFAVHYQASESRVQNFNAALVEIGGYFPLVRGDIGAGRFEVGTQAGIFSLFNLDSDSSNLINTDFVVGLPLSYRLGAFSARAEVSHQSSHLGDEFLLDHPNVNRINLSYEDAELLLAYDLLGFRLYGGGGYIFSSEPDLEPAHWRGGLEFRWPRLIAGLDLVAAGDFQEFEEQDWAVDRSYTLGVAYRRRDTGREIRLMLEYFNGFSPNGQFFNSRLEYAGVGLFFDL
jgi:hypothetical protein